MITSYQVLKRGIPKILQTGPKAHREISYKLKELFPEYCDDSVPCPHVKYNSGHPEWDHLARSAEQALKRNGLIEYDNHSRKWQLT